MIRLRTQKYYKEVKILGFIPLQLSSSTRFSFGNKLVRVRIGGLGAGEIFLNEGGSEKVIARIEIRKGLGLSYKNFQGVIVGEGFSLSVQNKFFMQRNVVVEVDGSEPFSIGLHAYHQVIHRSELMTLRTHLEPESDQWIEVECGDENEELGMILCSLAASFIFDVLLCRGDG